jgi:hypothetical protein
MSAVSWRLTVPSPRSRGHTGARTRSTLLKENTSTCLHSFSRSIPAEEQLTVPGYLLLILEGQKKNSKTKQAHTASTTSLPSNIWGRYALNHLIGQRVPMPGQSVPCLPSRSHSATLFILGLISCVEIKCRQILPNLQMLPSGRPLDWTLGLLWFNFYQHLQ